MIDTDRQPDDNYVGPDTDLAAVEAIARRTMSAFGIPQRIHAHAQTEPCTRDSRCRILEP